MCLSVKVSLTVGQLSLLLSTLLLRPYKFSTITRQGFFSPSSRNYSCLLCLPLILASLIYYSVFNLAI